MIIIGAKNKNPFIFVLKSTPTKKESIKKKKINCSIPVHIGLISTFRLLLYNKLKLLMTTSIPNRFCRKWIMFMVINWIG
ncbi:MAG: hypothetical protein QF824_02585 [Candidatus Woesearchaeota archaeon]|nr:hypothetical protein [Candidatus Woesearchaeota archaeon]